MTKTSGPTSDDEVVRRLEHFWSEQELFWNLREGRFHEEELDAFVSYLRGLDVSESARLSRRFVSLLWYAPLFMEWQADRVTELGGDVETYQRATSRVLGEVERLLGVP